MILGVGEVSASKVCGGAHGRLPPTPNFQKRSYAYADPINLLTNVENWDTLMPRQASSSAPLLRAPFTD